MAAFSLILLFALFLSLFPFIKGCPPPFPCGRVGPISYPFTSKFGFDAGCGLFVMDDCDKEIPKIKFDRGPGNWYQVESISPYEENGIQLPRDISFDMLISKNFSFDIKLQNQLSSNKCESFNNLSLPTLTYASFQIDSSLTTIYKCNHSVDFPEPSFNFISYTKCHDFKIYYPKKDNARIPRPLRNCSIVQLPLNTNNDHDDIFRMLAAKFSLNVSIRLDCYHCYLRGGECKTNNGTEKCIQPLPPPERHKVKCCLPGIGCATFTAIILMAIITFFWHRYKKRKNDSSNLLPRNTSADLFSKSDREGSNIFYGVSVFSYTELEEATNNFASENELGDGGFGTVHYGMLRDGREVAVKRLRERNYHKVQQFLNEIEILTRMRHKNLVSLYGCTSRRSRELLLVYEYIPNGTVADHLHGDQASSSPLTWPIRMRIAIETADALAYLHASDVIHRDVKTNNILLDNYFSVKVADFGLSRLFPNDVTHVSTAPQGTPGYLDPEYFQCYQLTDKSDVYSFGVVLVELLSSMPAVDITRQRGEINLAKLAVSKIQRSAFDELIDPCLGYQSDEEVKRMTTSVAELAFLCLQQDSELRPPMDEVLEELKRIDSPQEESHFLKENYDNA
ncbi:LEAF RUST 10 DISEASE-RESISTANCE LOCUS RECEPTOR-LIKE PROTEIN KINASE-like 1.1 [Hevea brasiliensis]|uniref:LEAF RUST 10 DISEASE-RESISTANCE LOCUS RECEPTOR-LIKE PROTEIN KINASE-like 1.1 n=1 Tax=Hevea brasiliensis TaxID=3981 RepID=UPI0025DBF950|nr:LEAF RUST 10 DISEASE-RESISTANCE LOCUS RECEPTOR-LIKE PROTEIN KINASE-like 1.1 [Hevea brasiliensis]